jgi:cytochrome c-type biogenesis protein CcmH/NrfG
MRICAGQNGQIDSRRQDLPAAIAAYTQAIRLDPHYALAFAARSIAFSHLAGEAETEAASP